MVCVRPGLFAIPIAYYVCTCSKTISINSSNIAIHKNLDPQKFSAIQYAHVKCSLASVGLAQTCPMTVLAYIVLNPVGQEAQTNKQD